MSATPKRFAKKNRSPIACKKCRSSKLRCVIEEGSAACQRCISTKSTCEFEVTKAQTNGIVKQKILQVIQSEPAEIVSKDIRVPDSSISPILPPKEQIIEIMEIFFSNQYQGIFPFIHKPSFLGFLMSEEFNPETYIVQYQTSFLKQSYAASLKYPDPVLLLSILALCSRLHSGVSFAYGKFCEDEGPENFQPESFSYETLGVNVDLTSASNASNYFGWYARHFMKQVFDSPTVQRIQAFTLLSSHEWGEGNNSRSFLYIGIAARMALVLGLGNENVINEEDLEDQNMKQMVIESKRRTIWSVYMMDRCNSSGRQRSPAIRIEEINIRLPASEEDFLYGIKNSSLTYSELSSKVKDKEYVEGVSLVGFTILLFEIWAKIAKWVGEVGVKNEKSSPWVAGSTFDTLYRSLDDVYDCLPSGFKLTDFNLKTRIQSSTATHYGYFHGLFAICRIFLNREYLFCNPESFPTGWWNNLCLQLLESLQTTSELMEELEKNGLMVVAPFTGFEIFTSAVTCFYFCSFPNEIILQHLSLQTFNVGNSLVEVEKWKFKFKKLALQNMDTLSNWTKAWELGRKWHKLSLNLGIIFGQLASNGSGEFNSDYLRHSMQDYGSGEVSEVYIPQRAVKNTKNDMEIMNILNKNTSPPGNVTSERISGVELLSPPQFLLLTNSPSIYPGWSGSEISEFIK